MLWEKGDRAFSLQRAKPSGSSQHPDQSPLSSSNPGNGTMDSSLSLPLCCTQGQNSRGSGKDLKLIMQLISLHIPDKNISIWTTCLNINGDKEALLGDESSIHGDLYLEIEVPKGRIHFHPLITLEGDLCEQVKH